MACRLSMPSLLLVCVKFSVPDVISPKRLFGRAFAHCSVAYARAAFCGPRIIRAFLAIFLGPSASFLQDQAAPFIINSRVTLIAAAGFAPRDWVSWPFMVPIGGYLGDFLYTYRHLLLFCSLVAGRTVPLAYHNGN